MSSRFHGITRAAALSAMLMLSSQAFAQSGEMDPEMRIQQLENQLRQLTGQNEELQYRNRQLEDRLRMLQGGAQAAPGAQPAAVQPNVAAVPGQPNPAYRQPQPGYEQQIASPAPIVQESPGSPPPQAGAAAMPSIPARIRMPRVLRVLWVAANCRLRMKLPSGLPADAEPASRSILPTPVRAIRRRHCRRRGRVRVLR